MPINLTKAKETYTKGTKTLERQALFITNYDFYASKGKIPLKSNKKRRIGTNNCILFCVLIWSGLRVSKEKRIENSFSDAKSTKQEAGRAADLRRR